MFFIRHILIRNNSSICWNSQNQFDFLCRKTLTRSTEIFKSSSHNTVTIAHRSCSSNSKQEPLTKRQKLEKAVKEYGSTVLVFHVTISLISLGGCYLAVYSGLDVESALKFFNISAINESSAVAGKASTFVIAYAIHKVFAPARISITLVSTPFIVRHLRRIGFLKDPAKR